MDRYIEKMLRNRAAGWFVRPFLRLLPSSQDWSDCRTELLPGSRKLQDATPQARRSEELYQGRIFGDDSSYKSPEKLEAVRISVNSSKNEGFLYGSWGRSPKEMAIRGVP